MSSGDEPSPSDIGFSTVFTDTSVLFDYALNADSRGAITLFENHASAKVISRNVKQEFESVRERRKQIHRSLLTYARKGELEEFDAPGDVRLTKNDWRYIEEVLNDLFDLAEQAEVVRRLNEKRRQLASAKSALFDGDDCYIDEVCNPDMDPQLKGYLELDVENTADVRILCDAVGWAQNDGSGTFLTSDSDDVLSNRAAIVQCIERYDRDGVLSILSVSQFLELDPDHE